MNESLRRRGGGGGGGALREKSPMAAASSRTDCGNALPVKPAALLQPYEQAAKTWLTIEMSLRRASPADAREGQRNDPDENARKNREAHEQQLALVEEQFQPDVVAGI